MGAYNCKRYWSYPVYWSADKGRKEAITKFKL